MSKITFQQAVGKMQNSLKKDQALREVYKSTIALCFYDEFKAKHKGKVPPKELLKISNAAAEKYLEIFCAK